MAILWDSYVSPADLTQYVKNVPTLQNLVLDQILPNREVPINEVAIEERTNTLRTAKFRAHDAPVTPGQRDSFTVRTVKLPNVSQMLSKGEKERLEIQRHQFGGTVFGAITDAVYDDALTNVRAIQARVELARGDLLTDGVITISELDGITADFGIPGSNLVTAGTLWSDTVNSTPIADLQTWCQSYLATNGFLPGSMVLPQTVVLNLLRNAQVRQSFSSLAGTPALVSRANLDEVFASFQLPRIKFTYDSQVVVDGTSTRVLPVNKVLLLPPDGIEVGYTAWGVTATGLELSSANVLPSPAGMVAVIDKETNPPYRESLYVDAAVLPVLTLPRALMIATVA